MKIKDLIKQLQKTNPENEVRIDFSTENKLNYQEKFHCSFDDVGDILMYNDGDDIK